jgi:hypothetical protein
MHLARALALVVLVACLAPVSVAGAATPEDDARQVGDDYKPDADVTPCRFTRAQLVNALNVASSVQDFDNYVPGFRDEVRAEIARIDAGGCKAKPAKPAANLKIVKVRPRRALRESVTVKNLGKRTAKLRGVTLRDGSGTRVRLGRARLGPGKSLRVFTGCAKGKRRFIRIRSRAFACRRRTVWNDGGDVVRLFTSGGTLLSRVGYGRFSSVQRF